MSASVIDEVKEIVADVIRDPEQLWDAVVEAWNELDPEDRAYLKAGVVAIPARWLARKYWQRKGAPEWAARGFATLGTAISLGPAKFAFEQRKRKREDVATQRKREFYDIFSE